MFSHGQSQSVGTFTHACLRGVVHSAVPLCFFGPQCWINHLETILEFVSGRKAMPQQRPSHQDRTKAYGTTTLHSSGNSVRACVSSACAQYMVTVHDQLCRQSRKNCHAGVASCLMWCLARVCPFLFLWAAYFWNGPMDIGIVLTITYNNCWASLHPRRDPVCICLTPQLVGFHMNTCGWWRKATITAYGGCSPTIWLHIKELGSSEKRRLHKSCGYLRKWQFFPYFFHCSFSKWFLNKK